MVRDNKMNTSTKPNHIRRGTVSEDGKVFWAYSKNKEIWISKEQYERRENSRREYVRKCREQYYKRQLAKHEVFRNFIGKYDSSKNMYFIRISSSGKEVWGSKEQLENFRKMHNKCRTRMYQKLKLQHPITGLKIGDRNPQNPNEYVIFFIGNKPYFGNAEHFKRRQKSRAITYRKRNSKYREMRKKKLQSLTARIRRGTVDPKTGLIFKHYTACGNEMWVTKENYMAMIEKEKIRKARLQARKYIKLCEASDNSSNQLIKNQMNKSD